MALLNTQYFQINRSKNFALRPKLQSILATARTPHNKIQRNIISIFNVIKNNPDLLMLMLYVNKQLARQNFYTRC